MTPNRVRPPRPAGPRRERGVMLLEALIAILIFSVGILAIVGMQSVAIKNVVEGKTRSDAGFLADEIIAKMWNDTVNIGSYAYVGSGTAPTQLTGWMTRVKSILPGADPAAVPAGVTPALPVIAVTNITTNALGVVNGGTVQITMQWQLPQEMTQNPPLPPHKYVVLASIYTN
jgi:type IV pilus assembly protein PilV